MDALVKGFRITVVLLMNLLSVSISYITSPLVLSARVVFRGEFLVKTSFMTITSRAPSCVGVQTEGLRHGE